MMTRPVVCLLVFILSVAYVCLEGDAKSCPENGLNKDGSNCTSDPPRTPETITTVSGGSSSDRIFISLYGEEKEYPVPPSTGSSNSGTTRSSTRAQDQGAPQGPVETAPDVGGAGQPTLSKNPEISLQGNPNDRNGLNEGEGGQHPVSPTAHEQSRGVKDSSSVTSATQPGHSKPGTGGEPNLGEQIQPPESTPPTQGNQGSSNNTGDNTTTGDSNTTQETSPAEASTTNATASQENGNADSTATNTNTTTEAPTTTPSPVPVTDPQISSIAPTVLRNKASVDSSISPVWMRTAAPLLIVAVLFSVTLY
ncbi:uncharacterized protein TM35_001231020 [Trypanosoma theileri]|uniref:Mucin TcMUCII n=1 Tax=Trypanosoma theileri TaxID=67003 RepID=A0A1X0NEA5_9TRYP|nr:uncharacterized protein TM35_001231020 [Trypanosoma theileri]ORC81282.1 hypothetical protein TM35_001231020 [Trypanosoma theileri]